MALCGKFAELPDLDRSTLYLDKKGEAGMSKSCRTLALVFWVLGLITTTVAVVWRLLPYYHRMNLNVEMRSVLLLAAVLFLGALATQAVSRTEPR